MAGRQRVVVVGLGDTGILVASHLGRRADVVAVGTTPALVSGQELGHRLAGNDHWRRNYLVPLERYRRLDRAHVVHGRVTGVDLAGRQVQIRRADGGRVLAAYDALVIASGVTNGFWRRDEVRDLADVERELAEVAARLGAAATVAVVGGGATGVSAAYNLARRHPDAAVHLFVGQDEPLPGYHPRVRRRIARDLETAGVRLHPGHRARLPDGFRGERLTSEPVAFTTGQDPFTADVVLWAVGAVTPNTGFLPAELLDDAGFVRVDEHLQVPGHPGVFAVGDVAASDPNRSSARNWGWRVVTRNVAAQGRGRANRLRRFRPPEHRWGSILGPQPEGMVVFQPDGSSFRVPPWAVQPVLYDVITNRAIYGGIRRPAATPTR